MATAYSVLELDQSATQEQIAEAFRRLCVECHPDRAKDEADRAARTAKMAKLTLAKRHLGDPEARAKYDRKLADLAARAKSPESSASAATPEDESIDAFLRRIRSGDASAMVTEFGRSAGIADQPGFDRVVVAAAKTTEVAKGLVDVITLIKGQ